MFFHSSSTKSKLLEYYAKRSREYSFALLLTIREELLKTTDDSKIEPLDIYFNKIVKDANIALKSLVNDPDMNKFRNWILD
jgi:hypothetical protein